MRTTALPRSAALGAMLLCSACQQLPPPNHYLMRPMGDPGMAAMPRTGAAWTGGRVIVVSPVRMPDYLDRQQLVSGRGLARVHFDEDNHWADRPSANIRQVVAANLQALLPGDIVLADPLPGRREADLNVLIDLADFQLNDGGRAVIQGRFTLIDGAGAMLQSLPADAREPAGITIGDQVAALDRDLLQISHRIAETIAALPPPENR